MSPLEHAQLIRDDDNRYGSSTGKPPLPALREADVERWLDLDGDGTDDVAIATVTKAKPFDMRRREIYVMRGPCGHHVGRIVHPVDSSPRLLSSRNNGLRDIELPHGACNEHYTCSAAYRFDGRRYVIVGPPFRCRRARCRLLRSD